MGNIKLTSSLQPYSALLLTSCLHTAQKRSVSAERVGQGEVGGGGGRGRGGQPQGAVHMAGLGLDV